MKTDSFTPFDDLLATASGGDPWLHSRGEEPNYSPDYGLLSQLLTIPTTEGKGANTGALANGVDSWLSHELRRAGFGEDEVWPRPTRPRILPRDVSLLLDRLNRSKNKDLVNSLRTALLDLPSVAPTDAKVLGRAYEKQVDVAISRWDRGPELLLSTKTQVSSFGKNLPNRFEEAYGDAGNLRGRYPLAAVGFFFVQRATILVNEPEAFERTVDMMRKLRGLEGHDGYTATGLVLVDWSPDDPTVRMELDRIPEDVRPEQFMRKMVEQVLNVTPVSQHVGVRNLIERRTLAVMDQDNEAVTA